MSRPENPGVRADNFLARSVLFKLVLRGARCTRNIDALQKSNCLLLQKRTSPFT